MAIYRFFYSFIFLMLWITCFGQAKQLEISFGRFQNNEVFFEDFLPNPTLIANITYDADVCITPEEFFYLIGLQLGESVSVQALRQAVFYLFKKNKFETITITKLNNDDHKVKLHFDLFGFWTLGKVKFHGVAIGKDSYRQHYAIQSGELFLKKEHQRSLKKIKHELQKEGYFDAVIYDEVIRNENNKTVSVNFSLERGRRFKIGAVSVLFDKKDNLISGFDTGLDSLAQTFSKRLYKKQYSKKTINKEVADIKQSMSKNGFLHGSVVLHESVNYKEQAVDLIFTFSFSRIRKFVFWGNSFFSDEDLLQTVLMFGHSVWLVPASILSQEIERAYHEKGFWDFSITVREEPKRDFFIIKEGMRAVIKEVVFKGNSNFDSTCLIKCCFKSFLKNHCFDDDALKKAVHDLIVFYQTQGFLDACIIKQDFVPIDIQKQMYRFELAIDEGPRSFWHLVSIDIFPELALRGPFTLCSKQKEPVPFDPRCLKKQKIWLQKYFSSRGYSYAQIKPVVTNEKTEISVQWNVDIEESKDLFGKTVVLGSFGFPFDNIRRELCYQEGETWSTEKIKQSTKRLQSLGIFESVSLYPDRSENAEHKKTMILKLEKDDPFELRFRAGLGLQQVSKAFVFGRGVTYKIGGSFLIKDPTHVGDVFEIDTDFARGYKNVSVEYVRPYLFGIPARSRFKVYANSYEQPGFVGSKKNLYEVVQQGFLIGLKEKRTLFDFGFSVGVEWMQTNVKRGMGKYLQSVASAIHFSPSLLGKKIPYIFFEPTLFVDRLNNKLNPTFGTFTLITLKAMLPLKQGIQDAEFVKFMAEQAFFYTIGGFITGALRFRFGHIFYQQFETIMPFERFYLGGSHSIRSYETDLCPPLGCFTDCDGLDYCVPQGGKSLFNLNAEIRFPLFASLGAVVFQDLGTLVGLSKQGMDISDLLAATGFGLRYDTPIGPLRFDVGWKWRKCKPTDYSYAWFLSLGHAF